MPYKELILPNEIALSYLKENLQDYKSYILIASHYLDSYNFNDIRCKTFWSDCYDYTIKNCLHGYLNDEKLSKLSKEWAVKQVRQFLSSSNERYCLCIELILKYPEAITKYSDKSLSIGGIDCCYLLAKDSSDRSIYNALTFGQDGHFGISVLIDGYGILTSGDDIPIEKIYALVQATKKIILGAYDEEGFVVIEQSE